MKTTADPPEKVSFFIFDGEEIKRHATAHMESGLAFHISTFHMYFVEDQHFLCMTEVI